MRGLRRADDVEKLYPESILPLMKQGWRKRLARRKADSQGAQIIFFFNAEQARIKGRYGEEKSRVILIDHLENLFRVGPVGPEDRGCPEAERKIKRIAQAVGEEEFRCGKADIGFVHSEDGLYEQIGDRNHVVLKMDGTFRRAGASRRVTPKADVVAVCSLGHEFIRCFGDQTVVGKSFSCGLADDDHMFQESSVDLVDFGKNRFMNDNGARPAVVD